MKTPFKGLLIGALLLASQAHALSRGDIESSALIKGTIVIGTDGTVQRVDVDNAEQAGQALTDVVRNTAMKWRFEPVMRDGQAVIARSQMSVRVVAKAQSDGNYAVRVKGASFGDGTTTDELRPSPDNKHRQPRYPEAAIRGRVQGTVYLVLQVNRQGNVTEADAEQVNLTGIGSETFANSGRKVLADSAIKVARTWTYEPPTTGPLARQDSWIVRVPVKFFLWREGEKEQVAFWETYLPGPRKDIPWIHAFERKTNEHYLVDALLDNTAQTEGAGPHLLTAIDQG